MTSKYRCDNGCAYQDRWKSIVTLTRAHSIGRLCTKNCKNSTELTGIIEISNKMYDLIAEIGCASYKEDELRVKKHE